MEEETNHQTHGTQTLSQYPLVVSYNSCTKDHQHFPSCGDRAKGVPLQMMNNVGLRFSNCSIYSNYELHWHPYQSSAECMRKNPQSLLVYQPGGFRDIFVPRAFSTIYELGTQRFTCCVRELLSMIHFSKRPALGDVFSSKQFDDVLILDLVSSKTPQGYHAQSLYASPKDRDLYHVHSENGVLILQRMGHENFTFHEENTTASYYLPDTDIALHFNRVPTNGDVFCSRRNGNVVILEALPTEISRELHNKHPQDKALYRVHERNGGFLLMTMDNNNMHSEEGFFLGGETQEENSTYTYYLPDKDMAFHFNRLPTDGDLFDSQRRNNIMILDAVPRDNKQELRLYGSPWDADLYRVQQRDDGFELVTVTNSPFVISAEDKIRRWLKIRRYNASPMDQDTENNVCGVCLAAYKDFDRVGGIGCAHEFHVSCITPWLRQKGFCPICKEKPSFKS